MIAVATSGFWCSTYYRADRNASKLLFRWQVYSVSPLYSNFGGKFFSQQFSMLLRRKGVCLTNPTSPNFDRTSNIVHHVRFG